MAFGTFQHFLYLMQCLCFRQQHHKVLVQADTILLGSLGKLAVQGFGETQGGFTAVRGTRPVTA